MPTELTRSPAINLLLNTIEQYQQEEVDGETVITVFNETVAFINEGLQKAFEGQVKISPPGSAMRSMAPEVQAALDQLRKTLDQLRRALETGSPGEALLAAVVDTTGRVFDAFDRLQAAEAKEPNLSRSPHLNPLMKVGFAVADGTMDPALFRTLLTNMVAYHHQMALFKPPAVATEAQRADMQSALKQHLEGLKEAERYFEDGQGAHIKQGLERSNQAVNRLYALDEAFQAAEAAARVKRCIRCSEENDVQARLCRRCQAPLPQVIDSTTSTVDVQIADQVKATGHVVSEVTQPLVEMVAEIRSGKKVLYDLNDPLQALEERIKTLWDQLKQVNPEEQAGSPEDLEAMKWAQEVMSQGIHEMVEGLNNMRRAVNAHDQAGLDVGMEAFLTGHDRIAEVYQAALNLAQQQQSVAP
ncbi:MAG TPA: hypothetical protein VGO93_11030 [Candidatus Xenobia bacterium]|jgi:hypothetical protein